MIRVAALSMRILEVHRAFLEQLLPFVSDVELADALHADFLAMAYPPVYPSPFDVAGVLAGARVARPALADELAAVEVVWRQASADIEAEMVRTYLAWKRDYCAILFYQTADYEAYAHRINSLQDRRAAASAHSAGSRSCS